MPISFKNKALISAAGLFIVSAVLYAFLALSSVALLDQARDIYFANQIATGVAYPLGGPPINGVFQLGPLWFYVCAIPLFFGGGYASVAAFVAVLSALKVPLAFYAGYLLNGLRFGWLMAFAVLTTGWAWISMRFLTHPALVEASLWGLLCVIIMWWRARSVQDARNTALSGLIGLVASVAFHAHPTTLMFGFFACALVFFESAKRKNWRAVIALLSGGVLLFLPYFYEQARDGWPVFAPTIAYANSAIAWPTFDRFLKLLIAPFVNGHSYELQYMADFSADAARFFIIFLAVVVVSLIAVSLRQIFQKKLLRTQSQHLAVPSLVALIALMLQCVFLLSIRPITPLWMLLSMLPLSAFLMACGLHALFVYRHGRYLAASIMLPVALAAMAPLPSYLNWNLTSFKLPNDESAGLLNVVDQPHDAKRIVKSLFRVRDIDSIAEKLVGYDVAHGQAASAIEGALGGVEGKPLHRDTLRLGGAETLSPTPKRIVGFNHAVWRAIGRKPTSFTKSMGWIVPIAVLHPQVGDAISSPNTAHIFLSRSKFEAVEAFTVTFDAPCSAAIVITNSLPAYLPLGIVNAWADAEAATPIYADQLSQAYKSKDCAEDQPVKWSFSINGIRRFVDVVAF